MKIAFTGVSGVGKTTLARFVADLMGIPLNPVGARSVALDMGFENPYMVDETARYPYEKAIKEGVSPQQAAAIAHGRWHNGDSLRPVFQKNLQAAKIDWEEQQDEFVTDRTPICDLAYLCLHAPHEVDTEFIERALEHTRSYDHIFWIPLEGGQWLARDPSRRNDPAYHEIHEALIRGFLERADVSVSIIDWEDLQQRKHQLVEELQGVGAAGQWWLNRPQQMQVHHHWTETGRYWDCPNCKSGGAYSEHLKEPHEMTCPKCGIVLRTADNWQVVPASDTVHDFIFLYDVVRPTLKLTPE